MVRSAVHLVTVAAFALLLWAGGVRPGSAEEAPAKPPEVHAGGEMSKTQKPKPKIKPKRPDKDKDCQYDRSEELEVDTKTVTITQETIKSIMAGHETEQDGYSFYANTTLLVLYVRDPDGNWYSGNMTRLGSEGCIFFYIGQMVPQQGEPPL